MTSEAASHGPDLITYWATQSIDDVARPHVLHCRESRPAACLLLFCERSDVQVDPRMQIQSRE